MARRPTPRPTPTKTTSAPAVANGIEALLLAAQAQDGESRETGRYVVTYKQGAIDAGRQALQAQSVRTADA